MKRKNKIFNYIVSIFLLAHINNVSSSVYVGQVAGANATGLQSDQMLIAAGSAVNNLVSYVVIARYTTSGELDTTYGDSGATVISVPSSTNQYAFDLVMQPDDKVVVVGNCVISGLSQALILRVNTDGTLDSTFGTNGIVTLALSSPTTVQAVTIQSNGQIVATGAFNNAAQEVLLFRLNTDGSLDSTFGTGGVTTTAINYAPSAMAIELQATQNIVVSGVLQGNNFLARYTTAGVLDTTFGSGGIVITNLGGLSIPYAMTVDPSDNLIVGGTLSNLGFLLRYTSAGVVDTTFGNNGLFTFASGLRCNIFNCFGMTNSEILVCGSSGSSALVGKISSTGALDTTFGDDSSGIMRLTEALDDSYSSGVLEDSSGNVLSAGRLCHGFLAYRLTATGALDTTYAAPSGFINEPSGDPCKVLPGMQS